MHKASVWGQREAVEEKEWGGMRRKARGRGTHHSVIRFHIAILTSRIYDAIQT